MQKIVAFGVSIFASRVSRKNSSNCENLISKPVKNPVFLFKVMFEGHSKIPRLFLTILFKIELLSTWTKYTNIRYFRKIRKPPSSLVYHGWVDPASGNL